MSEFGDRPERVCYFYLFFPLIRIAFVRTQQQQQQQQN